MGLISGLMRAAYFFSMKPCVTISQYGQRTPKPRVSVSVANGFRNKGGWFAKQLFKQVTSGSTQGVYCYDDTESGSAQAFMYAQGLAQIFGVPILDKRDGRYYADEYAARNQVTMTVAPGEYINIHDVVYRNRSGQAIVITPTKGMSVPEQLTRVTAEQESIDTVERNGRISRGF